MNVGKNWALTIKLTALAFTHFSSELLLKGQMIIPVKKMLNNTGRIHAKLIDFSENLLKKSSEIGCFLLIVSWRSFPRNFPWNRSIFLIICPWKSFEIWLFSAKIPQNQPIFLRMLTFFPRKSCEISRFFSEFAPENPAKFSFFSATYQKPCLYFFYWVQKTNAQIQQQQWPHEQRVVCL